MSFFAHPTGVPGGVPHHQRIRRHWLRYNRPCADKRKLTNVMTTNNRSISSYRCASFHQGACILILSVDGTSWIRHIGKHGRGPNENIVFTNDSRIKGYIILNFHIPTEYHLS